MRSVLALDMRLEDPEVVPNRDRRPALFLGERENGRMPVFASRVRLLVELGGNRPAVARFDAVTGGIVQREQTRRRRADHEEAGQEREGYADCGGGLGNPVERDELALPRPEKLDDDRDRERDARRKEESLRRTVCPL